MPSSLEDWPKALAAEQSSVASVHLKELSEQLNGLLKQFRV